MDVKVFGIVDIWVDEIISRVRIGYVEIIDEKYGIYVFKVVYLSFVLVGFGIEGSIISCRCILFGVGWVCSFYVFVRNL